MIIADDLEEADKTAIKRANKELGGVMVALGLVAAILPWVLGGAGERIVNVSLSDALSLIVPAASKAAHASPMTDMVQSTLIANALMAFVVAVWFCLVRWPANSYAKNLLLTNIGKLPKLLVLVCAAMILCGILIFFLYILPGPREAVLPGEARNRWELVFSLMTNSVSGLSLVGGVVTAAAFGCWNGLIISIQALTFLVLHIFGFRKIQ